MTTAVLRVDEPALDGDYPVSLSVWESAEALVEGRSGDLLASGRIPAGLITPPEAAGLRGLAAWLHSLFDRAGARDRLSRLRDASAEGPGGLRLYLDLRPRRVRQLPWEHIVEGMGSGSVGERATAVVRMARGFGTHRTRHDWSWPIAVMIVVGTMETAEDTRAEEEVRRLQDTLARHWAEVEVDVVRRPTHDKLLEELRRTQPHVLHIIGRADASRDGAARLEFELDRLHRPLRRWFCYSSAIDPGLRRAECIPRVVVLNACRTEAASRQPNTLEVAHAFADAGVAAVVPMQGPLGAADATSFHTAFYGSLTSGAPFDLAAATGRRAVATRLAEPTSRHTSLPTLILGQHPFAVLPPRWSRPEIRERVQRLESDNRPALLDRRRFRRMLLEQLDRTFVATRDEFASPPPRLIAISGRESTGKSALAKWAIARQVQRGRQAAYVALDTGGRRHGWLEVLRTTCETVRDAAFDAAPLDGFGDELDRRIARARGEQNLTDSDLREIASDFVRALRATSRRGTLVVAVDPLDIGDNALTAPVIPEVVSRIDAGDAGDTRLLFVKRGIAGEAPPARVSPPFPIWVDDFDIDATELESLWRQYLVVSSDNDERVESLVPLVVAIGVRTGSPVAILELFRAVERVASAGGR